jgi:hypothetical protein
MKKGKTSKITGFKSMKAIYGTTDSFDMVSIYLNLQTWVEPKKEMENWNRVVLNLSRSIKHTVYNNINRDIFKEIFIVDLDLRSSGLNMKKKSFMNLEINLYLSDKTTDFKSLQLRESLKDLSKNIYHNNILRNEYFAFYLSKNGDNQTASLNIN